MGRNLRAPAAQIVTGVPLGAVADVFRSGVNYRPVGTAVLRASYPDLAAAYPVTGSGLFVATLTTPLTGTWNACAYGNGVYVAVGPNGAVAVSSDGVSWSVNAVQTNSYADIIFANGKFVVVGGVNACMTSVDGITWNSVAMPVSNSLSYQNIAYGNGIYVAVAGGYNTVVGNAYVTSPDLVTWTSRVLPTNATWRGCRFGAGLFVAMSTTSDNKYATSADGINWTARTMAYSKSWEVLEFINGYFITMTGGLGMPNDTIGARSPDGIAWSYFSLPSASWTCVTYGNGQYLALSGGTGSGATIAASSTDGLTWGQRAIPSGTWKAIAFGAITGTFVGVLGGAQSNSSGNFYIEGATSSYLYLTGTAGKFLRVA